MTPAALVIALLGAGEVSIVVAPTVTCVDQSRLVSRIETAGMRVVNAPSRRLAVTVRLEKQQVVLRATRQGAPFERSMPAQGDDCDTVERVLVALIVAWSQQLPAAEPKPVLVRPPKEPAPEPPAVVTADPAPIEAPSGEVAPEPQTAPPLEVIPQPPPLGPPLITKPTTPPAPVAWPFSLDVGLLGGGTLGPTASVSGVGQLQLGASFGRVGALLEGGVESTRSATASSARVESSAQWLSLSGRVRFAPAKRLSLDLALGFRLWRITAQSFNAIDPKSVELLGLGGVFSAGASYALAGPVSLHLRAFTSLRTPPLRFLIDSIGPVLTLDPWEGGLLLGLEVRLFNGG